MVSSGPPPPPPLFSDDTPSPSGMQRSSPSHPDSPRSSNCAFTLDVERLPVNLKHALESAHSPISTRDRHELVRYVIEQMRAKATRPRREFLTAVAEEIVRMYPHALQDRGIDGQLLGRGYDSFFRQLENRVENITRGKTGPGAKTGDQFGRKNMKSAYGCLNWQPVPTCEAESLDEKIAFCRQESRKGLKDMDVPLAMDYMRDTYTEQRSYINSTEPVHHVVEIKEEWPLLLCRHFFYQHADQLLGKDVKETFQERLTKCAPALLEHLQTSAQRSIVQWMVEVEHAAKSNNRASEAALFPLLVAHFKEEHHDLFRILEEGTSVVDICSELPSTPIVVALGGIFKKKCFVVCEQIELFGEGMDFTEAMCVEFLLYYVFNMVYPGSVATTLEFIQRQLFNINPLSGTKCDGKRKSRTSVNVKVMKLAQALRMIL
ncbi:uncharacterized protein LOC144175597 [Haemaphysalis longicornis]